MFRREKFNCDYIFSGLWVLFSEYKSKNRKEERKMKTENSYVSARQQQAAHLSQGVWLHKGPVEAEQIGAFTRRALQTCAVFPRGLGPTDFYIISPLRMGWGHFQFENDLGSQAEVFNLYTLIIKCPEVWLINLLYREISLSLTKMVLGIILLFILLQWVDFTNNFYNAF